MVDLQHAGVVEHAEGRYSLLEKMVDLQRIGLDFSEAADTVYSKKWSICNTMPE